MKFAATITLLAAACGLAACASSPSSRFYTLAGAPAATVVNASASAPSSAFYFELAPVDVPQQVAKNQLVVQTSPAQVKVLEEERWASLPADEVRRALSADLTQRTGAIDVYGTPHSDAVPVYRVKVNVQRFESWPGEQAVIDAVWSVRAVGSQAVLTCRTVAQQPVGAGYDALVDGHRKAVDTLSVAISAGMRALAAMPHEAAASGSSASASAPKGASAPASRPKTAAASLPPCPVTNTAASATANVAVNAQ